MFFGIVADLFSSILTILLPIFASYKALRSSDPYQLAPWLMYWVVLSAILMAESWTVFILGWFPFYSWIRLGFFAYLVLPQTQGARILYQGYVDPFLTQHERDIEELIGSLHERAKALGLQYFYQIIDLIRERVLGLPPQRPETPPPATTSYAQSLLSRFNLPSAVGGNNPAPANDWYSAISSAVASVTAPGKSQEARAEELSASGSLLPREFESKSRAEKASFYSNQRDMLDVLRDAIMKEERNLDRDEDEGLAYGSGGGGVPLRKNRSDNSFDHIEHEDTRDRSPRPSGGWFGGGDQHHHQQQHPGSSSGVDFAMQAVDAIARARDGR